MFPFALGVLLFCTVADFGAQAFDDQLFISLLQQEYNYFRSLHNAPRVHLNRRLSQQAMSWAVTLGTVPNRYCLHHSGVGGENLFYYYSTKEVSETWLAKRVAEVFYDEMRDYDFGNPGFVGPAAHFTEMVWRSVREIGIAVYTKTYKNSHGGCNFRSFRGKPATAYFVVIHHSPKGNRSGHKQFKRNVLPPSRRVRLSIRR